MIRGIYALFIIAAAVWITVDASRLNARRGTIGGFLDMGPVGWFFAVLILWFVSLPCYFAIRPKLVAAHRYGAGGGNWYGGPGAYGGPGQYGAPQYGAPQYGGPQWGGPQYGASTGYGGPQPAQAYPVPMKPVAAVGALPPWETSGPPPGAQRSPDGHWWWDGGSWQPTGQ